VKWSFVGLFATALVQVVVVVLSGSVALLSDTVNNFGDAATVDIRVVGEGLGYAPLQPPEFGLRIPLVRA